ncbi:MAG: erythrose-4-phosphate dehydrogenase [Betaproteobacteria bacterium]|nr:erythrose-4-phosphate dehydrogenase [Betaproteobacteria bacterium]
MPLPSSFSPPPFRLVINGYGRIGRCFLRAITEAGLTERLQVVAINEPAELTSIAYLTRFDSTHGRFPGNVAETKDGLVLNGCPIAVTHAYTPEGVDWDALKPDLLVECSGQYHQRVDLARFIAAGVPRLLLSHPAASAPDVDATIVFGVNHTLLDRQAQIISGASCTTNAAIPVLATLLEEVGLEHVLITTLHSAMNDQPLIDGYHHPDLRRTRSAMQSIIPVATGLARGIERLLPQLTDRVTAKAIRVPTANVSALDMTLALKRATDATEINQLLEHAAAGKYRGQLATTNTPHASIDFNHDPHSAIIDMSQTQNVAPNIVNLLLWFDNEWGFANRLLDIAQYWLSAD